MEILFENVHLRTNDVQKKYLKYIFLSSPDWIFLHIASLILIVISLIMKFIFGVGSSSTFTLLIILILVQLTCLLLYCVLLRSFDKQLAEINNGNPIEICTRFTEDALHCHTSMGESFIIEYRHFKKVVVYQDLIIVFTKAKNAYYFDARCFTIGSNVAFLDFMRQKGIRCK